MLVLGVYGAKLKPFHQLHLKFLLYASVRYDTHNTKNYVQIKKKSTTTYSKLKLLLFPQRVDDRPGSHHGLLQGPPHVYDSDPRSR